MSIEEAVREPPRGAWVELANGGGVVFRDPTQLTRLEPARYTRKLKQLPHPDDRVEP